MRFFSILVPTSFLMWITSGFLYPGRCPHPISSYSDVPNVIKIKVTVYWLGGQILTLLCHFHLDNIPGNHIFFLSFLCRGNQVVSNWRFSGVNRGGFSFLLVYSFPLLLLFWTLHMTIPSVCWGAPLVSYWATEPTHSHLPLDFQLYKTNKNPKDPPKYILL